MGHDVAAGLPDLELRRIIIRNRCASRTGNDALETSVSLSEVVGAEGQEGNEIGRIPVAVDKGLGKADVAAGQEPDHRPPAQDVQIGHRAGFAPGGGKLRPVRQRHRQGARAPHGPACAPTRETRSRAGQRQADDRGG